VDIRQRMVRTEENLKKSIILVLSITIFTTVLVTGIVVNMISYGSAAVKSINVQPKTNQYPVTGTGHILSSATHGNVNVQPNTNQHAVTNTGSSHLEPSSYKPHVVYVCPAAGSANIQPKYRIVCSHTVPSANHATLLQCYVVSVVDGDSALPVPITANKACPAKFVDLWTPYLKVDPDTYYYKGKLLGCEGQMDDNIFTGGCYNWVNINNAPLEIKVQEGHDKHGWYQRNPATTTASDGTFGDTFQLCDKGGPDHNAYLTIYFHGGTISGSKYPGPYVNNLQSTGIGNMWFQLKPCQTSSQKSQ
jgi:hypothetical protein